MQKGNVRKISVVFVCTGNTCRSAMAEVIFRAELKKRALTGEFSVSSYGLRVRKGDMMNPAAVETLKKLGYGKHSHTAKVLTTKKARGADLIVCMTAEHKRAIGLPSCRTVGELTGGGDVADPYGGPAEEYERAARYLIYAADDIISAARKIAREKC